MDPFTGLEAEELDTLVTALTLLILDPAFEVSAELPIARVLRDMVDERIEQLELGM